MPQTSRAYAACESDGQESADAELRANVSCYGVQKHAALRRVFPDGVSSFSYVNSQSGIVCIDASRAFNMAVDFLRTGAAVCGSSRERGREPACMLPAQRSASLRHVCGDDGFDAGVGTEGYFAGLQRAHDVSAVSWRAGHADDAGKCAGCITAVAAGFVGAHEYASRWAR